MKLDKGMNVAKVNCKRGGKDCLSVCKDREGKKKEQKSTTKTANNNKNNENSMIKKK